MTVSVRSPPSCAAHPIPVMRTLNFPSERPDPSEDWKTDGRIENDGSGIENFTFVIWANAALHNQSTAKTAMPQRK